MGKYSLPSLLERGKRGSSPNLPVKQDFELNMQTLPRKQTNSPEGAPYGPFLAVQRSKNSLMNEEMTLYYASKLS